MRLGGEVANKGCGIKSVTTACRRLNPAFEGAEVFIHQTHHHWLKAVPKRASVFWHLLPAWAAGGNPLAKGWRC